MTESEKKRYNQYRWFLEQVEPYDGFETNDYYGVMVMKVMKNGSFDIRLQYSYASNAKNGSAFKVETIEEVLEWLELMESFAVDKSINRKAKKYNPNKVKDYTKKKPLSKEEKREELKNQKDWE